MDPPSQITHPAPALKVMILSCPSTFMSPLKRWAGVFKCSKKLRTTIHTISSDRKTPGLS